MATKRMSGHMGIDNNPIARQREQELKRSRGEISCAECWRLKVRCDKKIPCSSCVRRGCSAICPNGSLSTGNGSRFVLADTASLHAKLSEMSERIRQLEDALAITQASTSRDQHPLLRDELLAVKWGVQSKTGPTEEEEAVDKELIKPFGTLILSDQGVSRFFGPSGGTESLLVTGEYLKQVGSEDQPYPSLELPHDEIEPLDIARLSMDELLVHIKKSLPPYERAWSLCETYLAQSTWLSRPVRRDQLFSELLNVVYERKRPGHSNGNGSGHAHAHAHQNGNSGAPNGSSSPPTKFVTPTSYRMIHEYMLLFAVFAMGALCDLTIPPYSDEAENYYRLSRSLLTLEMICEMPSALIVQALILLAKYHAASDRRTSSEAQWTLSSLACVVAKNIGLHRDPARWDMDAKLIQRRRDIYWQLFVLENYQNLANGRPPLSSLKYEDCEFPDDLEQETSENGVLEPGFWAWKYRFFRDVIHKVNDVMSSKVSVKYAQVLEIDKQIREYPIPSRLHIPSGGSDWERDGQLMMERYTIWNLRNIILLYIHRGYFAKVLLRHPRNPLQSPYAPSFLSAFRCSLSILHLIRDCQEQMPKLMLRSWTICKHAFSALTILGSVVKRGPNSSLAPTALREFNFGIKFVELMTEDSKRARQALSILLGLRDRALQSYLRYHNGHESGLSASALQDFNEGMTPELAVLSGQTRLFEAASFTHRTGDLRSDAACISKLVMWGGPSMMLNGHDVVSSDSPGSTTTGGSSGDTGPSSESGQQSVSSSNQTSVRSSTSPEASGVYYSEEHHHYSKPNDSNSFPNSVESSPPAEHPEQPDQVEPPSVDLLSYARQLEEYYNPTGDGMGFDWPIDMNFATGVSGGAGMGDQSQVQAQAQYMNAVINGSASGSARSNGTDGLDLFGGYNIPIQTNSTTTTTNSNGFHQSTASSSSAATALPQAIPPPSSSSTSTFFDPTNSRDLFAVDTAFVQDFTGANPLRFGDATGWMAGNVGLGTDMGNIGSEVLNMGSQDTIDPLAELTTEPRAVDEWGYSNPLLGQAQNGQGYGQPEPSSYYPTQHPMSSNDSVAHGHSHSTTTQTPVKPSENINTSGGNNHQAWAQFMQQTGIYDSGLIHSNEPSNSNGQS